MVWFRLSVVLSVIIVFGGNFSFVSAESPMDMFTYALNELTRVISVPISALTGWAFSESDKEFESELKEFEGTSTNPPTDTHVSDLIQEAALAVHEAEEAISDAVQTAIIVSRDADMHAVETEKKVEPPSGAESITTETTVESPEMTTKVEIPETVIEVIKEETEKEMEIPINSENHETDKSETQKQESPESHETETNETETPKTRETDTHETETGIYETGIHETGNHEYKIPETGNHETGNHETGNYETRNYETENEEYMIPELAFLKRIESEREG